MLCLSSPGRMESICATLYTLPTLPRGGAVEGGAPASPRHFIERLTIRIGRSGLMIYVDHGLSPRALCTFKSIGMPSDAIESRLASTRLGQWSIVAK